MQERLLALSRATAGLYLFLKHFPQNLDEWLTDRLAEGIDTLDSVCGRVAADLLSAVTHMSNQGLQHFDMHVRNVLTDGDRLYVSDFGLALSSRFELTQDEVRFSRVNKDHDLAYVARELVNWLAGALTGEAGTRLDAPTRIEVVRRWAQGANLLSLPPGTAALVRTLAPVAVVMNDFYGRLRRQSRRTAFPAERVRSALAASGLRPRG